MKSKYLFPKGYLCFDGVFYTWSGWYGCQLESIERKRVRAGEYRTLQSIVPTFDYRIRIVRSERLGFFSFINTWTIDLNSDLNKANEQLYRFKKDLASLI